MSKNQRQVTIGDRARRAAEHIDRIGDAASGPQPPALQFKAPLQLVDLIDHDMLYVIEWVERRRGADTGALLRARTAEILLCATHAGGAAVGRSQSVQQSQAARIQFAAVG